MLIHRYDDMLIHRYDDMLIHRYDDMLIHRYDDMLHLQGNGLTTARRASEAITSFNFFNYRGNKPNVKLKILILCQQQ